MGLKGECCKYADCVMAIPQAPRNKSKIATAQAMYW